MASAMAGYRRLEQLDPTTGITLLASFLVVVTIAGVLYVNRSTPRATETVDVTAETTTGDAAEQSASGEGTSSENKLIAEPGDSNIARVGVSTTPVDRKWDHEKTTPAPSRNGNREPPAPAKAVPAAATSAPKPPAPAATSAAAATAKTEEPPTQPEPPSVTAARQASSESASAGASPPAPDASEEPSAAPEPPVTVAQAAPRFIAASNRLSQAELGALVKKFVFVYQAGDIDSFLSLFDESIRTNDRSTKAGLREDYEELFKSTTLRQMVVGDVAWDVDDRQARGWSNFEVRVRNQGEDELKVYRGSLTFHVEKKDGRPKIVRLFHGQWKASN